MIELQNDSRAKYAFKTRAICDFLLQVSGSMGVGRIFFRAGPLLDCY